ncbi:MAG: DUF547 domain-containing protein [Shackletoniella antarctica]|uniref:DUF547 domain-containing protein n=1 Tax=Shackletoniella antarctica TaxID=268115 RepID=A0A2W4WBR9_9CYAN|nr:MAG: DUF547 domain-containing protein [Shackletoniella antarctica]
MVRPQILIALGAIALLASCGSSPSLPQAEVSAADIASAGASATLTYDNYSTLLQTYVDSSGLVDYVALQANPEGLKTVVAELAAVSPEAYAAWDEPTQIAFLINAYNALTLQSIIDQNPLKGSIRDIVGVWNFRKHTVMGQPLTLDAIEHDILRKDFVEPRIHAALVCAALSCPTLSQEPYTGADLDQQLDDQVQQWLDGPYGLAIDQSANQVAISAIFDWFGDDWKPQYATEDGFTGSDKQRATLNFISQYLPPDDQAYLKAGNYKLNYLDYDWALNRQ